MHRSGGKSYRNGKLHTKPVKFNASSTEWIMFDYMRQNSITKSKHNTKVENFVIPIESSNINSIALDAVRMENDNWLYGCTAVQSSGDLTTCTEFVNLSAKSKIMPSKGKRKLFQVKKIGSFSILLCDQ